jgi:predicted HTH domain antitoxin
MKVEIELPQLTEERPYLPQGGTKNLLVELACRLYEKDVITFGQGREMCGLDYLSFQRELGAREIPRMTLESFELELTQHARRQ